MGSTRVLQNTITFVGAFINFQPLTIGGNDPAISIGNLILQTILGPPFCWRWNRNAVTFNSAQVAGVWQQDYQVSVTDFGFIEKSWTQDPASTTKDIKEMTVQTSISATSEPGRPSFVCAQGDDLAGDITFRVSTVPQKLYNITVQYQKKPAPILSLASTWSPVPDEMSYIYDWGFLAIASAISNDPRFPIFNQKFLSHLLGAQQGLDEMQRNIFLGNWLEITKAAIGADVKTRQGIAARQQ